LSFLGRRLFDEHTGIVTKLVTKQVEFLDGLAERDTIQQSLCQGHAAGITGLVEITREMALGIQQLVHLHESDASTFSTVVTNQELSCLKQAAFEHCRMCRTIIDSELPQVSDKVQTHLDAMETLLASH